MNSGKTSVNKYNTFGLRERWLAYYFDNFENYSKESAHGLNVDKQFPRFMDWLSDAGITIKGTESISDTGKLFASNYQKKSIIIWEIIWINLCDVSELFSWYIINYHSGKTYNRTELDNLLCDSYPQYTKPVRDNAMKAFLNTFKECPLGSTIPVCVPMIKGKNVVSISRRPHNELSMVAAAYSLYHYAERQKRFTLTVSEFYDESQKEGIYRQFGIERDVFERLLLSIQEESNHVCLVDS